MVQASILRFQVFYGAKFTDLQSGIFSFPVIESGFAVSMFTADFLEDSNCFMLLQILAICVSNIVSFTRIFPNNRKYRLIMTLDISGEHVLSKV
jgi:hypothetical protein